MCGSAAIHLQPIVSSLGGQTPVLHLQDAHRQQTVDWCDATQGTAAAFDFTTKVLIPTLVPRQHQIGPTLLSPQQDAGSCSSPCSLLQKQGEAGLVAQDVDIVTASRCLVQGVLQEALEHSQFWRLRDPAGKPPGVIGWWPARAVTFIDIHDTGANLLCIHPHPDLAANMHVLYAGCSHEGAFSCWQLWLCLCPTMLREYRPDGCAGRWLGTGSTQGHWPFPGDHLVQGYVYILTHPGTPCIFYDHLFTDGLRRASSVWGSLKRLLSSGGSLKVGTVGFQQAQQSIRSVPHLWHQSSSVFLVSLIVTCRLRQNTRKSREAWSVQVLCGMHDSEFVNACSRLFSPRSAGTASPRSPAATWGTHIAAALPMVATSALKPATSCVRPPSTASPAQTPSACRRMSRYGELCGGLCSL